MTEKFAVDLSAKKAFQAGGRKPKPRKKLKQEARRKLRRKANNFNFFDDSFSPVRLSSRDII